MESAEELGKGTIEGYGLQPVHKMSRSSAALAAEGLFQAFSLRMFTAF
jgi:hypothetical protein